MALELENMMVPISGHSAQVLSEDSKQALEIVVIFTAEASTLAALKGAGELADSLGARIKLVVPQVVPYPLSLDTPEVPLQISENHFRVLASNSKVETYVQIYLCRDRIDALRSLLKSESIVVIAGQKRWWWPTEDERLARKLRSAGHQVLFTEME
jgi:hypothetical protein